MSKFFKVTMFVETEDDMDDAVLDLHVKSLLESSPAVYNADVDFSKEVDIDDTPY